MSSSLEHLERQIARAVDYIGNLRTEVARLELSLLEATGGPGATASENTSFPSPDAPSLVVLVEENKSLRAERILLRKRIEDLIREIDGVID